GTTTQTYPIDRYYNYSSFETIYLQSEIGTQGTINSLAFYKSSGTDVNAITTVTIYMKHTTSTTLATGTYSTTGYTQVYSGSYTNSATSGWMEVTLSTPFLYNNTNNLQILILKGNQSYLSSGYPYWSYTTTSSTYRTRFNRNDDSQPTSLAQSYNRPNIRLSIAPPVTPASFAINVTNLDFGTVLVGANGIRTFTLTNSGGTALTGNITTPAGYTVAVAARSNKTVGQKEIRSTLAYTVNPYSNVTYNVTFTPTIAQTYSGSIGITSNDTNHPTNTLPITGNGATSPQINVSTNVLSHSLVEGNTFADHFTINNLGSQSLTYSIAVTYDSRRGVARSNETTLRDLNWLTVNPSSGSVTGGNSSQIAVDYSAVGVAPGTYGATITITSNDPASPTKDIDVTMTVLSSNHAPTIDMPATFSFDKNGTMVEAFGPYVADQDDDVITLSYLNNSHIHININGLQVTFTADQNWTGSEDITFTAQDEHGLNNSDIVTVTVNPVNLPTWTPVSYPNPMAMIYTAVTIDNVEAESGDIVAAFVNGECRGTATIANSRAASATISIYVSGNGETVYFKLYDVSNDEVYDAENTVTVNMGETQGAPGDYIPVDVVTTVSAPVNVHLQYQASNCTITWPVVANANTYYVYRCDTVNGVFSKIATVHTNSYLDASATGRTYFYYVTAEKTNGDK
ncbi:MAG TPA: hypothetical protein PKK33_03540, partial [Candidatus Cloacimonadota bacterium]|nr:hypothetical protein [Candidatus Cloacimonadota bacterium]